MKVTYNWLKDFVDIKIPAQDLGSKLTMAGLEVGAIEKRGGDFVLEIEITSNRPDWLSVAGIAREVAAVTSSKLKNQKPKIKTKIGKKVNSGIKIEIEDKKDCPLYTAKIIKGVRVGPAPDEMRNRLELVGCRSVNNIVDITNYLLFKLGEPLHAFDLDKLKGGRIIIRRARVGEKITTIDNIERTLDPDILVIADEEKPVAVAGIMGGKYAEVTNETKNILLEAAVFNPAITRRARQKLGVQSESSYRFERKVVREIVSQASLMAAGLIKQLCGGECVWASLSGSEKTPKITLNIDIASVNKLLGREIPVVRIKNILASLGFGVKPKAKNIFKIDVPSFRPDILLPVDLIEEIVRIYGYENMPASLPYIKPQLTDLSETDLIGLVKNILTGLGLNEVITYSLVDESLLKGLSCCANEPIEICNPLSQEQGVLRPTLIPGLLKCVSLNINRQQEQVNIFEIAKGFSPAETGVKEEWHLAVALCGEKFRLFPSGRVKDEAGVLHLKGLLEALFERLGIKNFGFIREPDSPKIGVLLNQQKIGLINQPGKEILEKFEIKNKQVFTLELSLDILLRNIDLKKKFSPLPKYPGISRDVSLIIQEDVLASQIIDEILRQRLDLLQEARITDYYKGQQIPPGFKGLTISCFYRCNDRTLTEAEIAPVHSRVCAILGDKFGAKIR